MLLDKYFLSYEFFIFHFIFLFSPTFAFLPLPNHIELMLKSLEHPLCSDFPTPPHPHEWLGPFALSQLHMIRIRIISLA